ncbi:flap endonuclease-1 [Tardisphaera saccharovorans]|mgnify:CR=1 FL=1
MGVDLRDLVQKQTVTLQQLSGKVVAIDGYNALYQFLSTIRGNDGRPLMDSRQRVTSHLSGLFYRTVNFLEKGVWPVYVFDGPAIKEKRKTIEQRMEVRLAAERLYREAVETGNEEEARKYGERAALLTPQMVDEAKALLEAMGVPWIQAAAEGEAQAAAMVRAGEAWAVGSQDYDSLLFGAERLVRNMTVSGRRKVPNENRYIPVDMELIDLGETLKSLGITREQLVDIGLMIGTDYNDGYEGIGPKKALSLIKQYGSLEEVIKAKGLDPSPLSLRELFLNPKVNPVERPKWGEISVEKVVSFLCDQHDFSRERVMENLARIRKKPERSSGQTSLTSFFG